MMVAAVVVQSLYDDGWLLMQDEEQVDYSKIEPSADFFAPPRGITAFFS